MKNYILKIVIGILSILCPIAGFANSTWYYTGPAFPDSPYQGDRITGSITIDMDNPTNVLVGVNDVVSWSFDAGPTLKNHIDSGMSGTTPYYISNSPATLSGGSNAYPGGPANQQNYPNTFDPIMYFDLEGRVTNYQISVVWAGKSLYDPTTGQYGSGEWYSNSRMILMMSAGHNYDYNYQMPDNWGQNWAFVAPGGTWTTNSTAAVDEPNVLLLLAIGATYLVESRRRKI